MQTHEELVFPLDRMIVSCHAIELPEPALIMIDNTAEVKIVPLAYLKSCHGFLDFDQVSTLAPSLDPEGMDFDWEFGEEFSTVAVEGSLVAIAYADEIIVWDMADKNFRISLPFENAREIKFYDKQVLCTSNSHCALFSLTDPNQLCHFEVQRPPGSSFKTADFFALKIAIGYRQNKVLSHAGVVVGEVHDLATGRKTTLLDRYNKRGEYRLNQLVGYGDRLFGASDTYSLWNGNNFTSQASNPHPTRWSTPIHTMSKIGDRLLSASNSVVAIDHPNDVSAGRFVTPKLFDQWRYGSVKIISVKPAGQYLIVTSGTEEYINRSIKRDQMIQVFDLLNAPLQPPTQTGPAPKDPRESKYDDD